MHLRNQRLWQNTWAYRFKLDGSPIAERTQWTQALFPPLIKKLYVGDTCWQEETFLQQSPTDINHSSGQAPGPGAVSQHNKLEFFGLYFLFCFVFLGVVSYVFACSDVHICVSAVWFYVFKERGKRTYSWVSREMGNIWEELEGKTWFKKERWNIIALCQKVQFLTF